MGCPRSKRRGDAARRPNTAPHWSCRPDGVGHDQTTEPPAGKEDRPERHPRHSGDHADRMRDAQPKEYNCCPEGERGIAANPVHQKHQNGKRQQLFEQVQMRAMGTVHPRAQQRQITGAANTQSNVTMPSSVVSSCVICVLLCADHIGAFIAVPVSSHDLSDAASRAQPSETPS